MPRSRGNTSTPEIGGGGGVTSEPDKSATAPGQARNLSADTSKQEEITFKAIAPASFGTKANGAAVDATKLKYWFYYAKVGVLSNSITVSVDTTASDVITAVGSTTGTDDKAKGRIEALADNLATGFMLGGLTAETKYRYTVVVVHPDGTTNSNPAPAQTSGAVRTTPSQATVVDSVSKTTVTASAKDGFTVTWDAADVMTAKKDDGESLQAGDVGYVVYYTSATEAPADKEAVKAAGSENTPTSGKVPVGEGQPKTATASGKAFVHTVYMVLEAINNTDTSKTKLSEITEYAVTGAATTPTAPTVNVTPGEAQLTVQVTPLSAGNFGTTDNGTPLDADTVTYIFYYAKKGEDIGGTNVEDAGVTSDHMYDALKTLDGSANTTDKGKIALTTAEGIGTPKVVPRLTPGGEYHYTVRVQEKDTPTNGANTAKAKATTLAPKPTVKKPLPATCGKAPWDPGQWCVSTLASEGFNGPYGIAATTDGNTLYVADTYNHQIKKLTLNADGSFEDPIIIAGDGTKDKWGTGTYKDNDTGKKAQFNYPAGIALAPDGNTLYVVDLRNHRIRKIALSGTYKVSTIAGSTFGYADGIGAVAKFKVPYEIAIDPKGTALYVTDTNNFRIRKITLPDGEVSTIAANLNWPKGIAVATGVLYFGVDTRAKVSNPNNIGKITLPDGPVNNIASGFSQPRGIAIAPDGKSLYVTDTRYHRIKKLTFKEDDGSLKSAEIIAGKIDKAGKADGIGTDAQFNEPAGIAAISNTVLYVVDTINNSIRKLEYKE